MLIEPVWIVLFSAVIGACVAVLALRRYRRRLPFAAALGAFTGAAGCLLVMLPLEFCTFEIERAAIDRVVGVGLLALVIGTLTGLAAWLYDRFASRQPVPIASVQPGSFRTPWLTPALFLAPTLIILVLFLYYPIIDTFSLSTRLVRLGVPRTAFVCVDNFTRLLEPREAYGNTILTTLGLAIAIVVIGMVLSLLIATAAYQPVKGARLYRTLLIWPYAISPVVAGIIFLLLFNPTGGLINHVLDNVFGIQIGWLNDPAAAPWAVIIASVWKSMGFNILFYIAGLQNVPKDLLEAAAIDGANAVQRFLRVVIPMLSPITFFLVITNMTYAFFDTFGTIDALTGGGPVNATETMMFRIYETGVGNNDLGKAAAQSIVLFALVIGLTVLQFRTSARSVNYGA
jgi:sn-glycerol 3-phosphate transport system permease protein